jgi:hypothetical protein
VRKVLAIAISVAAATTVYVLACGPELIELRPVETVVPAHMEQYGRGHVGVVRPHFARRYLVQAYRRFSDAPPLPNAVPSRAPLTDQGTRPVEQWRQLAGVGSNIPTDRDVGNYAFIRNCLDDAFVSAIRTLKARAARYGESSPQTRDWIRAQNAVFSNCGDGLVLPDAAPASADALTRADRAYQTAAAFFYGMRYDEAVERFRAISADPSSPWRPYGRYMAARALIRQGTVPEKAATEPLPAAEKELRSVLEDPSAAALHGSARGLLDLIAFRLQPLDRLGALTAALTRAPGVTDQQLTDYQRLMDRLVGDTTSFDYATIPNRAAIAASADLSDWTLVMQGIGDESADRALARWKQSRSLPWLIASLWKVAPSHAESPQLLDAAARVDRSSPAFLTTAFLRVRLLIARGQRAEARALLTTLPARQIDGVEAETLNLLDAERFMLADSMEELLETAARTILPERMEGYELSSPARKGFVFDDDAGAVFNVNMPLTRLVEAASSTILPDRLRLRLAAAAFARAWMLKRDREALAIAPILRALSPALGSDMARFESAVSAEDRHIAGLRLVLRTPGLRAGVIGVEDEAEYAERQPARKFDHLFRRNWWCSFADDARPSERWTPNSELIELLYTGRSIGVPSFLSADERAAAEREVNAMSALGTAPTYLAREAVKWAVARPSDTDAAEALAHAVEGTRWGCTDQSTTPASRSAFQTLHRLFPRTEWARKTRYWY